MRTSANLIPIRDLQHLPSFGGWSVTGPEPEFELDRELKGGWVRIRLAMSTKDVCRVELFTREAAGAASETWRKGWERSGTFEIDWYENLQNPIAFLGLSIYGTDNHCVIHRLTIDCLSLVVVTIHAIAAKCRLLSKYGATSGAIGRALRTIATGGFGRFRKKVFSGLNGPESRLLEQYDEVGLYREWRRRSALRDSDRSRLRILAGSPPRVPLFSILLPVDHGVLSALRRSISSVILQSYPWWELHISCGKGVGDDLAEMVASIPGSDHRVRIQECTTDPATSLAFPELLQTSTGEFVSILREGDELAVQALSCLATTVGNDPMIDMAYADEDVIDQDGVHTKPFFKPAWSPDYFLAWGYIGCPCVFRRRIVLQEGGFRLGRGSGAEIDMAIRFAARDRRIVHVADILYHRRDEARDRPVVVEQHARRVKTYFNNRGIHSAVEPGPVPGSVRTRILGRSHYKVSIIIPSACRHVRIRGHQTYYLTNCLESIKRTTYSNFELVVLRGSRLPRILRDTLEEFGAVQAVYTHPFNWSSAMNQGALLADGDYLLFLNDDVEVITPDWIESLLDFARLPEVGATGGKLFLPGGQLQHAGVSIRGGKPFHPFHGYPGESHGYYNNLVLPWNCQAVTGACLMTRASLFWRLGGFDTQFPLNYNDIDYCLRVRRAGYRVVCTPYARLTHHELGTRSSAVDPREADAFRARYQHQLSFDPYYNPHLCPESFAYRLSSRCISSR